LKDILLYPGSVFVLDGFNASKCSNYLSHFFSRIYGMISLFFCLYLLVLG